MMPDENAESDREAGECSDMANDSMDATNPDTAPETEWVVRDGMDVFSTDSEKIGEVAKVDGDSLVVRKGKLFSRTYYIPSSAIANVGADAIYLTMTKEIVEQQEWEHPTVAQASDHPSAVVIEADRESVIAHSDEPVTGTFAVKNAAQSGVFADDRSETGTFRDADSGVQAVEHGEVTDVSREEAAGTGESETPVDQTQPRQS